MGIHPFVNHTDYVHKGDYCYLGLIYKEDCVKHAGQGGLHTSN